MPPLQKYRRRGEDPLVERLLGPVKPDATAVNRKDGVIQRQAPMKGMSKLVTRTHRLESMPKPDAYGAHLRERKDLIARTGDRIRSGDIEAAEDTAGIGAPPSRATFERQERARQNLEGRRRRDPGGDINLTDRVKRATGLSELADTARYVADTSKATIRKARKAAARRRRPPI